MRVLFVTNRYPTERTPGSSPVIGQQKAALQRLGYCIDVLFIHSQRAKLEYLRAICRILWSCQLKARYDLVHAHFGGYCGLVARMQWRCPLVVTFRGSDLLLERLRPISRFVARRADAAIVMTAEMKRVLGQEDACVIPYGIDLEVFKPRERAEARRDLGLPQEALLLLFPYSPARPMKRFDLVERTTNLLKGEFPDMRLVAIHDRPPAAVAAHMNACDAMVLASDSEGAPVAVKEAMACNLPIVSVDVGDVVETIGNTEGCYIAERDPEDLARKLAIVLRARKRTNGLSAIKEASIERSAVAVAAVYERLSCRSLPGHPAGRRGPAREIDGACS